MFKKAELIIAGFTGLLIVVSIFVIFADGDAQTVSEKNSVQELSFDNPQQNEPILSDNIRDEEKPSEASPVVNESKESKPSLQQAPVVTKSSGPRSPEITNPSGFINTGGKPITINEFIGKKVVLVSFWTYSCINCQRTLPYLNSWYDKYRDQGLEIISIHTPEFSYERLLENVEEEVFNTYNIKYPVVLDNDYSTWRAFGNKYWPRKYLIDIDGNIVYDHIGEGAYEETEQEIQKALKERSDRLAQ